jgi:CRISPR-associated protein Csm1
LVAGRARPLPAIPRPTRAARPQPTAHGSAAHADRPGRPGGVAAARPAGARPAEPRRASTGQLRRLALPCLLGTPPGFDPSVYAQAKPLGPGAQQPAHAPDAAEYAQLWQRFLAALGAALLHHGPPGPEVWLCNLLGAIDAHLWPLPHAPGSDVPLVEHLRARAAIAWALEAALAGADPATAPDDEPRLLIVSAGFYDVTEHLQEVLNPEGDAGGVAKRLRARSLSVSVQAEGLAQAILEATGAPITQRLVSAGSRSWFVLPNLDQTTDRLSALRLEVERRGLDEGWALKPLLTWVPASLGELERNRYTHARAREAEVEAKLQPYRAALVERWTAAAPSVLVGRAGRPCRAYPQRRAERPDGLSHEAERDRLVGEGLVNPGLLGLRTDRAAPPGERLIETVGPALRLDLGGSAPDMRWRAQADFAPADHPWLVRPLIGQVPARTEVGGREVLDFGELARCGPPAGLVALAALKVDVDELGGFQAEIAKSHAFSTSLALARWLDWFFTFEVGELIRDRSVYSVYSGGDDLYLIGPWASMLELALLLHRAWTGYAKGLKLTISAGLHLFKPHEPVPVFTRAVGGAIERAKQDGRDRIHLFGRSLRWGEFAACQSRAHDLARRLASGRVSSGLINRLLELESIWAEGQAAAQDHLVRAMRYKAFVAHALRDRPTLMREWSDLFNHESELMRTAHVWMTWALYLNRTP